MRDEIELDVPDKRGDVAFGSLAAIACIGLAGATIVGEVTSPNADLRLGIILGVVAISILGISAVIMVVVRASELRNKEATC